MGREDSVPGGSCAGRIVYREDSVQGESVPGGKFTGRIVCWEDNMLGGSCAIRKVCVRKNLLGKCSGGMWSGGNQVTIQFSHPHFKGFQMDKSNFYSDQLNS